MKKYRGLVAVIFFLTIAIVVTVQTVNQYAKEQRILKSSVLETARIQLEHKAIELQQAKLDDKQQSISFYRHVKNYGSLAAITTALLSALIIAIAYYKAKTVHTIQLGEHREIKVRDKDLSDIGYITNGMLLAEQLEAYEQGQDKAFAMFLQLSNVMTRHISAIGQRGMYSAPVLKDQLAVTAAPIRVTPSFSELLNNDEIAPGKPLIIGYHNGQPEYRDMQALKSMAISGWQGSGKSLSMAYLIASSLLCYDARVFVVDPHKNHDKGLYSLIHPLESTGKVNIVNPFDTPKLISHLNSTLDDRLAGRESSAQAILLVIDELARLAKTEYFEHLVKFLERCTEETRKANITFIGGSNKWSARHFKGRADIRACMNSSLIFKTKPSQADLLLEDTQEKKLVKQIKRPGQAVLLTDFAEARVVQMPFVSLQDMQTVSKLVGDDPPVEISSVAPSNIQGGETIGPPRLKSTQGTSGAPHAQIGFHPQEKVQGTPVTTPVPSEHILEMLQAACEASPLSKTEWIRTFSKRAGISESLLKLILLERRNITQDTINKVWPHLEQGGGTHENSI